MICKFLLVKMHRWYCVGASVLVLLTCVLINSVIADKNNTTCVGDDIKVHVAELALNETIADEAVRFIKAAFILYSGDQTRMDQVIKAFNEKYTAFRWSIFQVSNVYNIQYHHYLYLTVAEGSDDAKSFIIFAGKS